MSSVSVLGLPEPLPPYGRKDRGRLWIKDHSMMVKAILVMLVCGALVLIIREVEDQYKKSGTPGNASSSSFPPNVVTDKEGRLNPKVKAFLRALGGIVFIVFLMWLVRYGVDAMSTARENRNIEKKKQQEIEDKEKQEKENFAVTPTQSTSPSIYTRVMTWTYGDQSPKPKAKRSLKSLLRSTKNKMTNVWWHLGIKKEISQWDREQIYAMMMTQLQQIQEAIEREQYLTAERQTNQLIQVFKNYKVDPPKSLIQLKERITNYLDEFVHELERG